MVRSGQDVTDAELAVMRVLWELGASTIRDITPLVYSKNTDSDYATVKKLLSRLEFKKFVRRQREKTAHVFEALVSRDQLVERRLNDLANDLCDGSQTPLLMTLLQNQEITPRQEKVLRDLIDQISATKPESNPKRKSKRRTEK